MNKSVCPYINYIFNSIDESYLKEKPKLSTAFNFSIYPYGAYNISSVYDIIDLSIFMLNNLFSVFVLKSNLDRYDKKLVETKSLSKDKGINILNLKPDFNKIVNGTTTIDIIKYTFDKGLLIQTEVTEKYKDFYTKTKNYIENISESHENSEIIIYENLFTILWNIMVMLNSLTQSTSPIELIDTDISISKIINRCHSNFIKLHPNRNPFVDLQKTTPISDFNSFNKPYKTKEIDSARDNSVSKFSRLLESQYILYELHFECLLLATHYRCEYEKLL